MQTSSTRALPCHQLWNSFCSRGHSFTVLSSYLSSSSLISSLHSDSRDIPEMLGRKWLLSRPDTRIQQFGISRSPEDGLLRFSISTEAHSNLGQLYVIRDDLLHPLMGGNKLRKMDALLPTIQSLSVTDVITCGGCQSAHAAALAVACAENGLRAHLLLRGERLVTPTGYNLISGMYGEVTYVSRSDYADRKALLTKYAETIADIKSIIWMDGLQNVPLAGSFKCKDSLKRVAIVNEGASGVMALLGLIRLVHYLSQSFCFGRNQEMQLVVDSGTGTTAVGLAIGICILRLPWKVIGVMLVGGIESYTTAATNLLVDFNNLNIESKITQEEFNNCIKWVQRKKPRKFGNILDGEIQRCGAIAKETGVLFDPIYTLAAWEVGCELSLQGDKKIVVLHTGGTMGLFGIAQRYATQF